MFQISQKSVYNTLIVKVKYIVISSLDFFKLYTNTFLTI